MKVTDRKYALELISPLATSYVEVWEGFKRLHELTLSKKYEEIEGSDSRVT
jgi:kynureninase